MLWRSMKKHQTKEFPVGEELDPNKVLPAIVTKADVWRWEACLKSCLLNWMSQLSSPFPAVQEELKVHLPHEQNSTRVVPGRVDRSRGDEDEYMDDFQLILDLYRQQGLPAIIFKFDRDECNDTVAYVLNQLEAAEAEWKKTSKQWAKKMSRYDEYLKSQGKTKGTKSANGSGMRLGDFSSKLEHERELGEVETSKWQSFDPEAPLPEFSLANSTTCPSTELESLIRDLKWKGIEDPVLLNGLRRGIACHHSGLPFKYRQM